MKSFPRLRAAVLAGLLIVIGSIRIATTWRTFSNTVDEPTHVSAGLELLQFYHYDLQPENPPLPRIVLAAAPLAGGMRLTAEANRFAQFHSLLYEHGDYAHNLVLMRVGSLVFFILAGAALFAWARREATEREALLAVLLFTTQPVVLGYSGLATLDAAATAGLAVALVAFSAWLHRPTFARAALLGFAYGFSILCKFSCIGYVPAACVAIYVLRLFGDPARRHERLRALATVLIVPFAAFLMVWAGYGFTVGQLADLGGFREQFGVFDRLLLAHLPPSTLLPTPKFFRGIAGLLAVDRGGFQSYLFGRLSNDGWWWYFPVATALKTTLASLLLVAVGGVVAWRLPRYRWLCTEALMAAVVITAVAMPSRLDLGIRYILPMYVPFSLAAAISTAALLDSGRRMFRFMAMLFLVLHVASSLAAHPDYFPYFNELAGGDPGRYLVDSNLDWGQDVLRLRSAVRERGIGQIELNLGWFDYDRLGFPPTGHVMSTQPTRGWIAISEHVYRIEHANGGWSWLDPYRMTRIGTSIRLYHVPQLSSAEATESDHEEILLPVAGTIGTVGAPVGVRFRVDQTVRNISTSPIRVGLSTCKTNQRPCELELQPEHVESLVAGPAQRPFIWVRVPRGIAKQLAFSTVIHAGNWPALEIPAISEKAFHQDWIVIPNVPTNARLNLRVWLHAAVSAGPTEICVYSSRDRRLIAEREIAVDQAGYFANGDLAQRFPELRGEPVDITVESRGAKVWAMVTTTDYRSGSIILSMPR